MPVGWADVVVTDTGALIECSCQSDTPAVHFGIVSVGIHEPGREIKACWAYGHAYAVVHGQDSNPGVCYVVRDDGLVVPNGPITCENGVALMPFSGQILVVFITDLARYVKWYLTPDLVTVGKAWYDQPAAVFPGTSQGIRDLEANGTPRLIDLEPTITLPNGETLFLWMQRENWIVGQSANALAQVAAWNGVRMLTVWKGNTGSPPRIGVSQQGVKVGISSTTPVFVSAPFQPFETAPVVREAIVAIGRPLWLGWFTFNGTDTDALHNCHLRVADPMYVTASDLLSPGYGTKIARWVSAPSDSDVDALEQAIARVQLAEPSVPALAYLTRSAQGGRLPKGTKKIAIEGYQGADETLAAFEARLRAQCARCDEPWIVAQAHTSNASLTKDVAALVPVYARVAKAIPKVQGILGFSGAGRATGYQDQPADVHDAWRALFKGIPSTPVIVKPAPTPHPEPSTPHPTPIPVPAPPVTIPEETDMPIQAGQKGAYRPWGSTIQPKRAIVAGHQDAGYLSIQKPSGKFTNFPSGEDRDTAGIGERVTFDGKVMIAQPSDPNTGPLHIYEWFSLGG